MEQYLRIYCDYQQDDWHDLLPYAEFVYNNTQSSSTLMTPFFANYGYNPRCNLRVNDNNRTSINLTAEELVEKFNRLHLTLRANLRQAQEAYKQYYDRHAQEAPVINIGDMVWLNRKNIKTTRPSQKLDVKKMGPFKVEAIIGDTKLAYRLDLPPQMRIHPVFHVSLLEPHRQSSLAGRSQPEPPPIEIDGEMEYEVQEIVDSRIHYGRLQYYVEWEGYGPRGRTWEYAEELQNHASDAVVEFHRRYPQCLSPTNITPRPARAPE